MSNEIMKQSENQLAFAMQPDAAKVLELQDPVTVKRDEGAKPLKEAVEEYAKKLFNAPFRIFPTSCVLRGDIAARGLQEHVSSVEWQSAGIAKVGVTFDQAYEEIKRYARDKSWFSEAWLYQESARFFVVRNGRKAPLFALVRKERIGALSEKSAIIAAEAMNDALYAAPAEETEAIDAMLPTSPTATSSFGELFTPTTSALS